MTTRCVRRNWNWNWIGLVSWSLLLSFATVGSVVAQTNPAPPPLAASTAAAAVNEPSGVLGSDDYRLVNVEEGIAALRQANKDLAGSVKRAPVTFAAAIAKARALANAAVPPASLTKTLAALPDQQPLTLRLFAAALFAKGQPSAAFAVLVAAYDRAPDSADTLSDLAGLLAGFGYANESIALLDELKRRGVEPTPPLGLSGRDLTDYVRGYALVRLGDTAAARPLLEGVAQRQPLLAEAPRMLVILSDDEAEQRKYFVQGVWRHPSPRAVSTDVSLDAPEPDPVTTGEEIAIDVRSLLDLSKGKPGTQPQSRYAKDVLQANDLQAKLPRLNDAARQRSSALTSQRGKPQKYHHTDTAIEDTWGYRMQWLANTIEWRDAKLRDLERKIRVADRERKDAERRIKTKRDEAATAATDAYMKECLAAKYSPTAEQIGEKMRPAFEAALSEFLPYINRQELAERAWFSEWHLLATAIAAQVGDPGWHEYIRLSIESKRWQTYAHLLFLAELHADIGVNALITKEAGEVSTEPEPEDVEKCNGNSSIGFSTESLPGGGKLPFELGLEMTCEGMSLEASVSTRIPGVSISAEIGGDNSGNFTAFVGPKAEANIGAKEIAAFTGSAKGGAYVSGNRDGIKEAGLKYEVKAGSRFGGLTATQKIAEGSVNFIPAPDPGEGGLMPYAAK